eukprot:5910153-Prymnesium_polylepis.1
MMGSVSSSDDADPPPLAAGYLLPELPLRDRRRVMLPTTDGIAQSSASLCRDRQQMQFLALATLSFVLVVEVLE